MIEMTNRYPTVTFCDVWETVDDFSEDYATCGIPQALTDQNSIKTIYYLLFARYANRPILNLDVVQWKYKIFSIIFSEGPTWEKRLEIQTKLRTLTEDQLLTGSKQIYNQASNPSGAPATSMLEEIETVNAQTISNVKRGKLEAYSGLLDLLKTDITSSFIAKFEKCFSKFINERPVLYITEE